MCGSEKVVVACQEEAAEMDVFGDEQFAAFGAAGGHPWWEGGHAGDGVEDGVFGCDPVVRPGDEAGAEEGFGGEHFGGVAHGEAVAVDVDDGFKGGEEDGEGFELVVCGLDGAVFGHEVGDDEAFGVERGEHVLADLGLVFSL